MSLCESKSVLHYTNAIGYVFGVTGLYDMETVLIQKKYTHGLLLLLRSKDLGQQDLQ